MSDHLNQSQFEQHIGTLENEGVSFPGPGVAQVGGRAFPASQVSHERFTEQQVGGKRQLGHWGTDIHMPDERVGDQHLLMVNHDGSQVNSMVFHPATRSPDARGAESGSMFWSRTSPPDDGRASRGEVVHSREDFLDRLPDKIRNMPSGSPGQEHLGHGPPSVQPFHQVSDHTPTTSGGTIAAHEWDPASRSLMRDPEQDFH